MTTEAERLVDEDPVWEDGVYELNRIKCRLVPNPDNEQDVAVMVRGMPDARRAKLLAEWIAKRFVWTDLFLEGE